MLGFVQRGFSAFALAGAGLAALQGGLRAAIRVGLAGSSLGSGEMLHAQAATPEDGARALGQCLKTFPDFVKWPPNHGAAHAFGILGEHPIADTLEKMDVTVRRSERAEDLTTCRLVFVTVARPEKELAIVSELESAHVLTVGASEGFAKRGGVIGIIFEGEKVRFEINTAAAARAGLRIDSRLLRLAVRIFSS